MKHLRYWIWWVGVLGCTLGSVGLQAQRPEPLQRKDSASWSMILLPDPQSYTKFDYNHPIFELMLQWIVKNQERLNLKLVLCTGDLVEQNQRTTPHGVNGNLASDAQWKFISEAFAILDSKIPYILCTGNHDHGFERAENRYSQLNSFFPINRNTGYAQLLRGTLANAEGIPTLENAWYEYVDPQGVRYLIFSLEFNPRPEVVAEAREVVARPEYRDHRVIYLTHSYMKSDGTRFEQETYYKVKQVTCGAQLWTQLIFPSPNSSMVLCGHVVDAMTHRGQVGFRSDKNEAGRMVQQMMFNAQAEGGGWHGNGGDGWLRLLEFHPDGKRVSVQTFSPLFGASPTTQKEALRTASYDAFDFILE
ncbi:MAG: metallophosphoesterase [Alistipes sp.]|nr:metallophosphoesterase [Alistipes sp.]